MGPRCSHYREVELAAPGEGEARVAHRAIGVNFIDVYHRTGLYPLTLPSGLGGEGAGVVTAVGTGVAHVAPGDRVAYTAPAPLGSYADERIVDARWLVKLPDAVGEQTGAAMMLKGLTAWYLLKRSYASRPATGSCCMPRPAASGSSRRNGRASSARASSASSAPRRSASSRSRMAASTCCSTATTSRARVRELSGGGVPVVYDSVGRTTFYQSLDCLRPHGVLVSFGNSSGKVEPFGLHELTRRGSLYVTRPTLYDFIRDRAALEAGAAELFALVERGRVEIEVNQTYALRDAAQAHRDLEARKTTGCTVLIP